ncbi:MAG: DNA-3-methyladenine glycosylase 2 family protein [Peptococcaceae bacterium]|nr:DNA-3-methyladenine glycosylase 2 family protein [Peptococcaceae bacterium]
MDIIQAEEAYIQLGADPKLSPIIEKWGKCKLKRGENYFFELCRSIMAQQISTKVAQKLQQRMEELFDGDVSAEKVLKTPVEELQSIGISRRKTETIHAIASLCQGDSLLFHQIDEMTDQEVSAYLTRIKGVGAWTVTMFLIFALNRPRVIPSGDFGIRKALQNLFGLQNLPSPQQVEELYRVWAPHESAASWYLWRSLEND